MCDPFEDRDPDLLFPVATEPDAVPNSGEACSEFITFLAFPGSLYDIVVQPDKI